MFKTALPVWEAGKENEMNVFLRFIARTPAGNGLIRIAVNSVYRIFIENQFVCAGPARTAHGFSRVDEIPFFTSGESEICIEAGAYCCNSFEYLDESGFLQCEIEWNGQIIAATGQYGFRAYSLSEKLQKVQRYSFQRTFCEEYDFTQPRSGKEITLSVQPLRKLLPRNIPLGEYPLHEAKSILQRGGVYRDKNRKAPSFRYNDKIGKNQKGFSKQELETHLLEDVCTLVFTREPQRNGYFELHDMGRNITGFIGFEIELQGNAELFLLFDEILTEGTVNFVRSETTNAIRFRLSSGTYSLLTFEPYTFRYLKFACLGSACMIRTVHVKQVINSSTLYPITSKDPVLAKIYHAALETYRQNAVDIFMDCPSRERAGWLCDSFFTARTEYALTKQCLVEHNFLENYLLPDHFSCLPHGMLPMCYPADHYDGVFIPNWAMWLVIELKEYLERSGDHKMIHRFKDKVYALIQYFSHFRNEDGLLENLDGWVFVEWSKANSFTEGVNYPTNMLYSFMLICAGVLYHDHTLIEQGNLIKSTIQKQSFDGTFFHDHAVRRNGVLHVAPERTETCQYYAFFCGIAQTEDSHFATLWKTIFYKGIMPSEKVLDLPMDCNTLTGSVNL